MALIYVAKSGNDTTGNGSSGNPYLTIAKGIAMSGDDDEVVVRAGTYTGEGGGNGLGLEPKSNTTIRAETYPTLNGPTGGGMWSASHSVVIDQGAGGTSKRGFYCAAKNNVTIIGFEIKNAFNGVQFGGDPNYNNTLKNCRIHHCSDNGISTTTACLLTIDGNEVYECTPNLSGRSNISVYRSKSSGSGTLAGGYHIRVTNNVSHHSMTSGGNTSDANGIIIDKMHYYPDTFEGMKVLVQGNYCYLNRGPGIKVTASKNVDVLDNTVYDNGKVVVTSSSNKPTTWAGDISSQNARANTYLRNIGVATGAQPKRSGQPSDPNGKAGGFANNGQSTGYEDTWPLDGNTIEDNLFWGYDKDGSGGFLPATDQNVQSGAQSAAGAPTNKLGTAIGITSIGQIFENADADPPDLRVKSTSVAYNGAGSQHIGAWKGAVAPPPAVMTVATSPVLTILGATIGGTVSNPTYPVGATVNFTVGTYTSAAGTVTRTFTVQWYNGTGYEAKTATITGPSGGVYSFTAPDVSKVGGLRIKEAATDGTTSLDNFSNWINIGPATVPTDVAPTCSVDPSIASTSAPIVGSPVTASLGTWAGSPTPTLAGQWKAGGTNIVGATSLIYTPVSGDIGKALTFAVTGTNTAGALTRTSAATAAVVGTVTPDDLEGLTLRVVALESRDTATRSDLDASNAQSVARDNEQDTVILANAERLGALETYTSGVTERVGSLEAALAAQQAGVASDLDALRARIDDVYSVIGAGLVAGMSSRDLKHSLNQIEVGNYREAGRVFRALLAQALRDGQA